MCVTAPGALQQWVHSRPYVAALVCRRFSRLTIHSPRSRVRVREGLGDGAEASRSGRQAGWPGPVRQQLSSRTGVPLRTEPRGDDWHRSHRADRAYRRGVPSLHRVETYLRPFESGSTPTSTPQSVDGPMPGLVAIRECRPAYAPRSRAEHRTKPEAAARGLSDESSGLLKTDRSPMH